MRKILINIGLSFTVFVALLIIMELISRVLCPHWAPARAERTEFWNYDSLLGWSHKPLKKGTFKHDEFSTTVSINSQGLRDNEYPLENNVEGKKRILLIGDSFGWGFGVEQENRFDDIIEAKYPNLEIINASVSGYGTDQEYLYLKKKGIKFHPDFVLLLLSSNDFEDNNQIERYHHNKPVFRLINNELQLRNVPVPTLSVKQRILNYVIGETYFFYRIYATIKVLDQKLLGSYFRKNVVYSSDTANISKYDITKTLLLEINSFTHANNIMLIVVSGSLSKPKEEILTNTLESANIPYISLDDALAQVGDKARFRRDPHWNVLGHKIVAEAIEKSLLDLNIISIN